MESKDLEILQKAFEIVLCRKVNIESIIQYLIYAGLKKAYPEVFDAFIAQKGSLINLIDITNPEEEEICQDLEPDLIRDYLQKLDHTEGPVWNREYFFKKGSTMLPAYVGDFTTFYCIFEGKPTGASTMIENGWVLVNEFGVILDKKQSMKIRDRIKRHRVKKCILEEFAENENLDEN